LFFFTVDETFHEKNVTHWKKKKMFLETDVASENFLVSHPADGISTFDSLPNLER
jgi:hypothetical protein